MLVEDSVILTGPNFFQESLNDALVTPTGGVQVALADALANASGHPGGSNTQIQFNNNGVFGGIATTGSGSAVLGTSPSLATPTIAGATLSGTFAGTPTFSGATTFSAGITTSGSSTLTFGSGTGGAVTLAPGSGASAGFLTFNGGGGTIAVPAAKTLTLGNTATGTVNVNLSPLTITTGTETVTTNITPAITGTIALTGTATGNPALHYSGYQFTVQSDNVVLPGVNQFSNGFQVQHNYGGAAMTGNRQAMQVNLIQNATTGNTIVGGNAGFYCAFQSYATNAFNDNGSGLTSGTAHGRVFGGGLAAQLTSGATNYYQCTGLELNAQIATGASALIRSFLSVATVSGAVQGTLVDAGLWFYGGGSGAALKNGILFGSGTLNNWNIDSTGTIIGADSGGGVSAAAAYGIDFSAVTFSSGFLKSTGFLVDPTGIVTGASYKVSANQVVGARITGWGAATNGAKTAFNGSTATLAQTSAAVAQLIADLTTHGLIGT